MGAVCTAVGGRPKTYASASAKGACVPQEEETPSSGALSSEQAWKLLLNFLNGAAASPSFVLLPQAPIPCCPIFCLFTHLSCLCFLLGFGSIFLVTPFLSTSLTFLLRCCFEAYPCFLPSPEKCPSIPVLLYSFFL